MKNKKYFKRDSTSSQYNSRLQSFGGVWDNFGEGYLESIKLIEKEVLENDRTKQDFLIYPYCHLIRHFIEIRLKEIIYVGSKKLNGNPDKIQTNHNLSDLWQKVKAILKEVWQDNFKEAPKKVSGFIQEFYEIDPNSDSFRFPFDTKGNRVLKGIIDKEINFKNLSESFKAVEEYLNGVTDGLAMNESF